MPEANLQQEAPVFAKRLKATVRSAFGAQIAPFQAVAAPFVVKQDAPTGIELRVDDVVLLQLSVEYRCMWDHRGAYLPVEDVQPWCLHPAGR